MANINTLEETLRRDVAVVAAKTIVFDGTSGKGSLPATAALTTDLTGANNDLTFTAVATDASGNDVTVAYIDPEDVSQSLGVSVVGSAITVSLATDGSGDITSTAAQVDAAIDGEEDAAALVTPANAGGNNGTGIVTAMEATPLTGGASGYVSLFSVPRGMVNCKVVAECTTSLAGATATVKIGTPLSTAALLVQTTATDIDAGEIWHDASPDASIEASTVLTEKMVSQDIILTVGTAAVTAGALTVYCLWKPLAERGKVTPQ